MKMFAFLKRKTKKEQSYGIDELIADISVPLNPDRKIPRRERFLRVRLSALYEEVRRDMLDQLNDSRIGKPTRPDMEWAKIAMARLRMCKVGLDIGAYDMVELLMDKIVKRHAIIETEVKHGSDKTDPTGALATALTSLENAPGPLSLARGPFLTYRKPYYLHPFARDAEP